MGDGAAARRPQGQVHRRALRQSRWGMGSRQEQHRQKGEGQGLLGDGDARNEGAEARKTPQKPGPLEQQAWAGEKCRGGGRSGQVTQPSSFDASSLAERFNTACEAKTAWVQISPLPLPSCVALCKLLNFSGPLIPQPGIIIEPDFIRLLSGLRECTKHPEQCLADSAM